MNLTNLLSVTLGGVTLHNVLQYGVRRLTAGLNRVAADVESGNVKALEHDAAGVVDFVETHDPSLAKAVEAKYADVKASAEAEVAKLRHDAEEELRKLAESVEKAAGVPAVQPSVEAPQGASQA